jgi:hypothetical protein
MLAQRDGESTADGTAERTPDDAAVPESDFDPRSLVESALQQDDAIRQWVATGSVPRERLEKQLNLDELDNAGVQERANLAQAEANLAALRRDEPRRRRPPTSLRVLHRAVWVFPLGAAAAFAGLLIAGAMNPASFATGGFLVAVAASEGALVAWRTSRESDHRWGKIATLEYEISEAEKGVDRNRAGVRHAVLEESVKPQLRVMLNTNRLDLYRTTLINVEHEGLAEMEDPKWAIGTAARRRLDHFLTQMPGGSIGLSGPRGAGKSTLIRAVCPSGGGGPIVGVVVDAPVQFTAREFILHLFAELCRTVLGRDGVERLRRPDPLSRVRSNTRLLVLGVAVASAVTVLAGTLVILVEVAPEKWGITSQLVWGAVLVTAGLLLYLSMIRYQRVSAYFAERADRAETMAREMRLDQFREEATTVSQEAAALAAERLQDIWFQQTFTTGWSGALKLPIGVEGGLNGTTELARQQMSMPDIVGELRRLIKEIAVPGVSVRIGIDELDKMDSAEDAAKFVNEIKVLFGMPGCFFLLSVSEDAMSAFERRGLPFRDVFDSSFDDIVRVGYMDVGSSTELLQRRVLGMPIPFIALCHCMAGGLPRDLIRIAREMISRNADTEGDSRLAEMCGQLVGTDVKAKAEASVVACRRMAPGPDVQPLQSWFQDAAGAAASADVLLERCSSAATQLAFVRREVPADAKGPTSVALASEFLVFCFFEATLLQYFSGTRSPEEYANAVTATDGSRPIDRLAVARQAFVIHPSVAWAAIADFRSENQLTESVPFPQFGT